MGWIESIFWWLLLVNTVGFGLLLIGFFVFRKVRWPAERIRVIQLTFGAIVAVALFSSVPGLPRVYLGLLPGSVERSSVPVAERSSESFSMGEPLPEEDFSLGADEPVEELFLEEMPEVKTLAAPWWDVAFSFDHRAGYGLMVGLFGLIACYLVLERFIGAWRLGQIVRTSAAVPEWVDRLLTEIQGESKRPVRVLASEKIPSPLTFGRRRPVILLPMCMVEAGDRATLRYCLAHEWAHIRRGDVTMWRLVNLGRMLLWPQPIFWVLRRELRICQDYLADSDAARLGAHPADYAELLLGFAKKPLGSPAFGALGIQDRKSVLYRRIEMLVRHSGTISRTCPLRVTLAALAILSVTAITASTVRFDSAQADEPTTEATAQAEQAPAQEETASSETPAEPVATTEAASPEKKQPAMKSKTPTAKGSATPKGEVEVYRVDKKVSDFPDAADFSSPEAAYATINRKMGSADFDWRKVSVWSLGNRLSSKDAKGRPLSEEVVADYLNAKILQVRILKGTMAQVSAEMERVIDIRSFELEDGRWLNRGNDVVRSEAEVEEKFNRMAGIRVSAPRRPPVDDPEAVLKPYQKYLETAGVAPKDFVLDCVERHALVAIGEIHHRPTYWALNSQIVRDPRFAKAAAAVYLELPSHAQPLVDEFLASEKLDTRPVVEMLRDVLWMGWPDRPMLDFFVAVWEANQNLKKSDRIRIVLIDMPRPWNELIKEKNSRKYNTDRDKLMAENILRDRDRFPDKRHALMIVGYAHLENLKYSYGGLPIKRLGWHLRQALGDELYMIVQHGPVIRNMGGIRGRTCLGLFDEAFAKNENRPVAFALAESPFGRQRFDLDADRCSRTSSTFEEAFDAYLYLGPLEDEIFSPLIDGFYTDEFVQEIDQRMRLLHGRGLQEAYSIEACDGRSFAAWMSRSWGKPRTWKYRLGPFDAWHEGDGWAEKIAERHYRKAIENPEIILKEAKAVFNALRHYDPKKGIIFHYQVHHYHDVWREWVKTHFTKNPIREFKLGEVYLNEEGLPTVPYELIRAEGEPLTGSLPFQYHPQCGVWEGTQGLDWHLRSE